MSEVHSSSRNLSVPLAPDNKMAYGATAMRLSLLQWMIVIVSVLLVSFAIPVVWQRMEPLHTSTDYRVPYGLSEDYWLYRRFIQAAAGNDNIILIGDSVIWGEYVSPEETLSEHLNRLNGKPLFTNGGANGTHPLALHGLVRNFAGEMVEARVILHLNLLWISSPERDLSVEKEQAFNHPRLVPQFTPWIPCYKAPLNERLGIVLDRNISVRNWVHHLRVAYFNAQSISAWTIEHPWENPFNQITLNLPEPIGRPHSPPIRWAERGMAVAQGLTWMKLEDSLQWKAFQRTVYQFQSDDRLFVIVNPFNEHFLTEESRERYQNLRREAEDWLRDQKVPYVAPPVLPAEEYADASHPLRAGYARLAHHVYNQESFQSWKDKG